MSTLRVMLWASLSSAVLAPSALRAIENDSPLSEKAANFQQDLLQKHWLDGLYVSIVPFATPGTTVPHTVNEPGNVIHAGVWTGRYLAGVGYQYAVTKDAAVRRHGGQILVALRRLQEVTGKPGLLARGYVRGHGPVMDWERDGADSVEWHQGQGEYADYRWYGDVSVDNFNAVLYGYAVYFDLAADDEQKQTIAHDVHRLMTHLLDHHCRIVDVDGEVTRWGHVGVDPDPARGEYYDRVMGARYRAYGVASAEALPLRASLMLLPDLLIAHHITGLERYRQTYDQVVTRFKNNLPPRRTEDAGASARRVRLDHSPEGQAYEALYNLIRYEHDTELLDIYRKWVSELWEVNWMEGNSLFTYMTLALLPEYRAPDEPGVLRGPWPDVPHSAEAHRLAQETLVRFPVDRVLRPVMNSLRHDIAIDERAGGRGQPLAVTPLPIDQRPLDNEYEWKGNPYRLDGWLKPTVTAMQFACDDPRVAWFADSRGRVSMSVDGGGTWQDMSAGLMGASVRNILASRQRTFVLWADTDRGVFITRDGGMSWRSPAASEEGSFPSYDFSQWHELPAGGAVRIDADGKLVHSTDGGATASAAMDGWRIPLVRSIFQAPDGVMASGPGGCYHTRDGRRWEERKLWREDETGAADFLHAYWMGRYYGFVAAD